MPTYRRLLGLFSLTGLLGLLVVCNAAEPRPESLRGDSCLAPVTGTPTCPGKDACIELPEPIVWERDTAKALQATVKMTATRATRPSKHDQREAMIEQLLAVLESTRSSAAFLMTLESLVLLDAPAEKLVPICLKAVERVDQFKPMPDEKNESQRTMMEGIGECLRVTLEKHARQPKSSPTGGTSRAMTLPSPYYLEHPPQMVPPAAVTVPACAAPASRGEAECIWVTPATPIRLPDPLPMAAPAPRSLKQTEPVPVQFGVPLQMPVPRATPGSAPGGVPVNQPMAQPQTSLSPIPAFLPTSGATAGLPTEPGIIPVSTLPPARVNTLEALPTDSFNPARLVPVPVLPKSPADVRPCEPR